MKREEQTIIEVCNRFAIKGEYRYYEVINSGHINTTYRVFYYRNNELKDYILQRVNTYVFQNPEQVMENISAVTEFVRAKIKQVQTTAKRNVLHYVTTHDDKYYTYTNDGEFWRCCRYIDDSVCFLKSDNLRIIEGAGQKFGEFQVHLADYPVESLHIVIPHFHNTINRYEDLKKAIAMDIHDRASSVQAEIDGFMSVRDIAIKPYQLQKQNILPLRVTHNDTKISNVLFDAKTLDPLSVIDLDTVMPGLVAFDFGDAIRICASTGEEDERDLNNVALDLEKYEAFTKGFVQQVRDSLTEDEKRTLALGAIAMTAECGARFLTDYLNGDVYFRTHYDGHNLVRARAQLTLAKDMIKHLDEMQAIVDKYC